jgi:hypothetical protein
MEDLVEQVESTGIWRHMPPFRLGLFEPRDGYELRGTERSEEPDLVLVQQTTDGERLAGVYLGRTVSVREELNGERLRGKGLGTELILAAFVQCQWKPGEQQDFTADGLRAFERAHGFITEKANALQANSDG